MKLAKPSCFQENDREAYRMLQIKGFEAERLLAHSLPILFAVGLYRALRTGI